MTIDMSTAAAPGLLTKLGQLLKLILVFVVGTLLSLAAWVSYQGWFVCSDHFFGRFSAYNIWKREIVLFQGIGYLLLSRAWSFSFRRCFGSSDDIDDAGGLGFIVGYILAEYNGISLFSPDDNGECLPVIIVMLFHHGATNKLRRMEVNGAAAGDLVVIFCYILAEYNVIGLVNPDDFGKCLPLVIVVVVFVWALLEQQLCGTGTGTNADDAVRAQMQQARLDFIASCEAEHQKNLESTC